MYHYTESGLQNVWLSNGYQVKKTANGKRLPLPTPIAFTGPSAVPSRAGPYMTGAEFRFLRKEVDLSQSRFGSLIDASEEAVSLWERRGRVPKSACRIMQLLYLETIDGNVKIRELVERLAELDRTEQSRLVFEDTAKGWREAA
jgi:DNA-binding transcriptional regulator YiaG